MKTLLLASTVCLLLAGCKEDAAARTAALNRCMMSSEASVPLLLDEVVRCMDVAGYDHGHRSALCVDILDYDFDPGIQALGNGRFVPTRSDAEQLMTLNAACFNKRGIWQQAS